MAPGIVHEGDTLKPKARKAAAKLKRGRSKKTKR